MRNKSMDCFKGILTILMIYGHCLQFFINFELSRPFYFISEYINVTTFSGFMFAFGFVAYHAYLMKPFAKASRSILKNAGKTLVSFYISSFAFRIFVDGIPYNPQAVLDTLLFKNIAGWSEFLASFSAIMIVLLIFFPLFKKVNGIFVAVTFGFSLLMCLIPYKNTPGIVSIFIGDKNGASFPVFQYLIYFVIGIYFAKECPAFKPLHLGIAAAASMVFFICLIRGEYPSRFPPGIPWILGAMLFLYGYYLLSRIVVDGRFAGWLSRIGGNSLFYLLVSNLLIFAMKSSGFYRIGPVYATVIFAVILFTIHYLINLIRVFPKEGGKIYTA